MYYFAYGSNMRVAQMAWRCPMARPVGIARLDDFSFKINKSGAATISADQGKYVYGILWRCTRTCITTLDIHEGVSKGHYRRKILQVTLAGKNINALTYIANNQHPSRSPARGYLTHFVIRGAQEFGIAEDYVEHLYHWQGNHILKQGRKRPLVKISHYRQKRENIKNPNQRKKNHLRPFTS